MLQSLQRQPDMIMLIATWLRDKCVLLLCSGLWRMSQGQRRDKGAGVSIFSRVDWFIDKVEHLSICSNTIESCVVKVELGTVIYRPHADMIDNFGVQKEGLLRKNILEIFYIVAAVDLNTNLLYRNCTHVTNMVYGIAVFYPPSQSPPAFHQMNNLGNSSLLNHTRCNSPCRYSLELFSLKITDHSNIYFDRTEIRK